MQCRFADQAESTKPLDAETQASGLQFREGSRFKDLAESLRLQLPETPVSQKPPATGTKVHSKLGLEGTGKRRCKSSPSRDINLSAAQLPFESIQRSMIKQSSD